MKIRQTKLKELAIISNLYMAANPFATLKNIKKWTKKGLINFPDLNLVYEDNGKIIGAISAILENRAVIINDIVVSEKYRGRKIGKKLMLAMLEILQAKKIKKIGLWVHWKNTRAIPFYYQFCFQVKKVMQTKNIERVPDGEDIIYMEKIN